MGKFEDLTGRRFGRLVVLGISKDVYTDKKGNHYTLWDCQCDCGNTVALRICSLIRTKKSPTRSCGCLRSEVCTNNHLKHGESKTRLYKVWKSIRKRCYSQNEEDFKYYGGRGIVMCDEWKDDFLSFKKWAEESGYDKDAKTGKCTIDRIDVNGSYCPENCRWITIQEQSMNRRSNNILEYQGEKKTIKEWAEEIGINYSTLSWRINVQGWTVEDALTKPVQNKKGMVNNGASS